MLLEPTADQDFLRETTSRFLGNEVPVAELRRLRDVAGGFATGYWSKGAQLGWTSLLVDEEHGGGSVSGRGLIDLTLIAHEFGRHAAPGPLLSTNIVAAALGASPDTTHRVVLDSLLAGETTAAWCFQESSGFDRVDLQARVEGAEIVLDGTKRPVEHAAEADHLLVTGRTGDGLTQVVVPARHPGVSVTPMTTVDLTRRFSLVRFDRARLPLASIVGGVGTAGPEAQRLLRLALVILSAESVGAMERAFEMTVEWAFDRYSFGRPLASYQELKHRFADMKSWLEAGHAITDAAADAVDSGSPEAAELAGAAKAFTGQYGGELMQDCVQIHGGIGVTYEHDLHLFLRRLTLDRGLLGTPAQHRQRIAEIRIEQESS